MPMPTPMPPPFARAFWLSALLWVGCGGQVPPEVHGADCEPAVLTNCPQDVVPDAGECPLPPIVGAQGFYTVGCKIAASCTYGAQNCSCVQGTAGPGWACE